ncbi:MAG: sulfatase-like hydrolase/transferase [Spirochaetes bacterium]|nr:sulfatase-like hydrolase/transferase [Spirochaetota bacterium]
MMSILLRKLAGRYDSILRLFLANGLFVLLVHALYRIRVYGLIDAIYPDILAGFHEYFALTLHTDGMTILVTLLIFLSLIMILGRPGWIAYGILSIAQTLLSFFMLFSLQFFRVYETTFQTSYAGREHFTSLANVVDSARSEFTLEFYLLFTLLAALGTGINIAIFFMESRAPLHVSHERGATRAIWAMRLMPPAVICTLLLLSLTTDSSLPQSIASRHGDGKAPAVISMLREFSMHPLANLFTGGDRKISSASPHEGGISFTWRFATDSIESPRRHPRLGAIPRNKRYNIILFFFESMPARYYDITINGRPVVPSWHRLERNSISFKKHYCNYPLSANALLSIFTSAYGLYSKDMAIQKHPDLGLPTMPEILHEHGYRTCLIHTGGLGYAGQNRFLRNRKFDRIIDYNQLIRIPPYNRQVGWGVDERAMIGPSIEFIQEERDEPFFLVLMPVNPHHPYAIPDNSFRITGEIPEGIDYKKRNWYNYLNSLHYADHSLGKLIDELESRGLMEDTLLFLFADHGEAFYQHRMNYNHPLFLYEENVHVPFLVYNRKLFPGPVHYRGITRHIDILPTVLDMLGIPRDPRQEGLSIFAAGENQMALLHTSWKDDYLGIADGRWKYICRMKDMLEELYDMERDPLEKNNIANSRPEITARYREVVLNAREHMKEYYRRIIR